MSIFMLFFLSMSNTIFYFSSHFTRLKLFINKNIDFNESYFYLEIVKKKITTNCGNVTMLFSPISNTIIADLILIWYFPLQGIEILPLKRILIWKKKIFNNFFLKVMIVFADTDTKKICKHEKRPPIQRLKYNFWDYWS